MYFITLDTLPNKNNCMGRGAKVSSFFFCFLKKISLECLKLLLHRDSFLINRNGDFVLQWRVSSTSQHHEKRLAAGQPLSGAAPSVSPVAVPQFPSCKIRLHRKICYTCGGGRQKAGGEGVALRAPANQGAGEARILAAVRMRPLARPHRGGGWRGCLTHFCNNRERLSPPLALKLFSSP